MHTRRDTIQITLRQYIHTDTKHRYTHRYVPDTHTQRINTQIHSAAATHTHTDTQRSDTHTHTDTQTHRDTHTHRYTYTQRVHTHTHNI